MPAPWKKNNDQPSQHIKKQRCYFAKKALSSQSYPYIISIPRFFICKMGIIPMLEGCCEVF